MYYVVDRGDTIDKHYVVVRNGVHPDVVKLVKNSLLLARNVEYVLNKIPFDNHDAFADDQCKKSWPMYSHITSEALMLNVQPIIERIFNVQLLPTYSYSRIYWTGSDMAKHKDRPSCEFSASICIDVDPAPWPIWFGGEELVLYPGDFVAYRGTEVEHWRDEFTGNQQIQVFAHFVNKAGPYTGFTNDCRPTLGIPVQYCDPQRHNKPERALLEQKEMEKMKNEANTRGSREVFEPGRNNKRKKSS